jgi:hypothetical protein
MAENPYTRSRTIEIVEIVPEREQLPFCSAVLLGETELCGYRARYTQNGNPVCGVHVGRPHVIFYQKPKRVRAAG